MTLKSIGKTDLRVTTLGFGPASLGNLYKAAPDKEALQTLETAIA